MLHQEVKSSIDRSVLCWLATTDADGFPNVSPKEIFTYHADNQLLIANIASPNSVKNILQNEKICVSFVDIFVQKGFKIKGLAKIIKSGEEGFEHFAAPLRILAGEAFPFSSLTLIEVQKVTPIISPRYRFYPETSEKEQIESAKATYLLKLSLNS
jgi:uncharacterized protein